MMCKLSWVRKVQIMAYTNRFPIAMTDESCLQRDIEKWQYRLPGKTFSMCPQ
ncbi:hypothetical protein FOCG_18253 [Fusarium oxysporum f. sp. radicis-lycopersici 26381]|nr:hypothetical protein FOCG_18253 [Fusarium oxysporum f. sp. radicis-lycopersici 26381]